jgi:hypothetical protein
MEDDRACRIGDYLRFTIHHLPMKEITDGTPSWNSHLDHNSRLGLDVRQRTMVVS